MNAMVVSGYSFSAGTATLWGNKSEFNSQGRHMDFRDTGPYLTFKLNLLRQCVSLPLIWVRIPGNSLCSTVKLVPQSKSHFKEQLAWRGNAHAQCTMPFTYIRTSWSHITVFSWKSWVSPRAIAAIQTMLASGSFPSWQALKDSLIFIRNNQWGITF